MNKKSPYKNNKAVPPRSSKWLPIIAGGAVLLLVIGLAVWWSSSTSAPAAGVPQQAGGAPRLAVDRTTIDDGYVKFNTPIEATFKLNNTGQQPLQILGEPQVELIEGC